LSPRQLNTRSRSRSVVGLGALVLTATLCTAAFAAVQGDSARLPADRVSAAREISDQSAKLDAERARAAAVRSDRLTWPLHGAVTGQFGEPRGGHTHEGLDIPMPAGTPVRAAGDGTVVLRELQDGYGKYTCIAHRRITTCYGHQSRFHTSPGAVVRRGQVIGYVGNTGNSGVTHLHFEVRRGTRAWGTAVDPARFLPRG
jgi:murein DD-endopeptidase MepM/ murein hydrolase activator NlpD